jgi:hypothetical protein
VTRRRRAAIHAKFLKLVERVHARVEREEREHLAKLAAAGALERRASRSASRTKRKSSDPSEGE